MSKYWITPEGNYVIGYNADIAPQNATEVSGPPEGHEGSWPPEETDIWVNGEWTRDVVVVAANVRDKRDALLLSTDWVVIRAKELGQDVPLAVYNYRGDLRQVPDQAGFPHTIIWPEKEI